MDFKNIQRRVYDAVNVLEALGVVTKEKNMLTYQGIEKADTCHMERPEEEEEPKSTESCSMTKPTALNKTDDEQI